MYGSKTRTGFPTPIPPDQCIVNTSFEAELRIGDQFNAFILRFRSLFVGDVGLICRRGVYGYAETFDIDLRYIF
jgi:hypothetical protein